MCIIITGDMMNHYSDNSTEFDTMFRDNESGEIIGGLTFTDNDEPMIVFVDNYQVFDNESLSYCDGILLNFWSYILPDAIMAVCREFGWAPVN